MNFKVRIHPTVRRLIGECGFSRSAVIRLHLDLYSQIEAGALRHRHNRVPKWPECFWFFRIVVDGNFSYECRFVVKDHANEMEVLWLKHKRRPRKQ